MITRPRIGSIPARAGKPSAANRTSCANWVYPRTGGETDSGSEDAPGAPGLSPHGRGNLRVVHPIVFRFGSIPARAGKPQRIDRPKILLRVYPRTGGETVACFDSAQGQQGLSPHGRGNPDRHDPGLQPRGSIPARAGKPRRHDEESPEHRVYPRTGGETRTPGSAVVDDLGLSPHGRGNRLSRQSLVPDTGSIPARAGKPCMASLGAPTPRVYPRTGGETRDASERA